MKGLLAGIVLIIVIGLAGFLYRNAMERPMPVGACTADGKLCPDGTTLGRVPPTCAFPACPPPNVEVANLGVAFVLPAGFSESQSADASVVANYDAPVASSTNHNSLVIHRYAIP